jgi:hypothetical protein
MLGVPITPFHFGPGLLVKGVGPRVFSWTAFCASNIVIDFESLYYLERNEWPVHRQLHTFVGAGIVGVVVAMAMMVVARWLPKRWFRGAAWKAEVSRGGIVSGALVGALSHPVLDGIMHTDIEPLQPWSDANPLHAVLGLAALHLGCLIAGLVGVVLLLARNRSWRRDSTSER